MFTQTPQHIIDGEDELLQAGMDLNDIENLKGLIKVASINAQDAHEAASQSIEVTSQRIRGIERLSPDIQAIMRKFAIRYHAYIVEYKEVLNADVFRKRLLDTLPSLPEDEVLHMANKVISLASHVEGIAPETLYEEVLWLIRQNPKNTKNANIFHHVIDAYVSKIKSENGIDREEVLGAWIGLDQIAQVLMTDEEFPYHVKPCKLNTVGKKFQKALHMIVKGVQTRKRELIRLGIQDKLIQGGELGDYMEQLLWNIEEHIH